MKNVSKKWLANLAGVLAGLALICQASFAAEPASPPATVMARCGKLLIADDFSRTEVGDTWKTSRDEYKIRDGVFITGQLPNHGHPAVCRTELNLKDAVVDFRFRFAGAKQLTLVLNDKDYKQSHAGHICRASVSPTQVSLGDDREGAMKFGIYERWKDPDKKSEVAAIVRDKQLKKPLTLDTSVWHRMTVEFVGEEMVCSIDGHPVAYFKSPGFAHPTKNYWGFTTSGQFVEIDDVQAWSAELDPNWPARRSAIKTQ